MRAQQYIQLLLYCVVTLWMSICVGCVLILPYDVGWGMWGVSLGGQMVGTWSNSVRVLHCYTVGGM